MKNKIIKNKKGFSLAEILIATAIATIIFFAVFRFGNSVFSLNSDAQKSLSAQSDARQILKTMAKELRSASPSSLGSYPISLASATSITFFVNLDNDAYKEQVRYYVQDKELKKGVTKPSGSPLAYNLSNEKTSILVHDLNNGTSPTFEYFDSSYTGTSSPLTQPVQITAVRLVRITLIIEPDPNKSAGALKATSQVFLRNLKDNL